MDGMSDLSREEAFALLKKYNQDPFHILFGLKSVVNSPGRAFSTKIQN